MTDAAANGSAKVSWNGNTFVVNATAVGILGAIGLWVATVTGVVEPAPVPTNPGVSGSPGALLQFEAMADDVDHLVQARASAARQESAQTAILQELAASQRALVHVAQAQANTSSRIERTLTDHRVESATSNAAARAAMR